MNIRQQLDAFWAGDRPDQIPYTCYFHKLPQPLDDPALQQMFRDGLGATCFIPTWEITYRDVEIRDETTVAEGRELRRQTWRTPIGEVYGTWIDGWQRKFFLETPDDYRVMTFVAQHTEITPAYESYLAQEAALPDYAVAVPRMGRTPLQTILVDYTGLENFAWHLYEYEDEMRALYDALLDVFRRHIEIVASGPGRYINLVENFTAETLGPRRYEAFLLPVYEQTFGLLHDAGKIVGCHYDGKTASCRDAIARSPVDLIESITPPPEGDQTLAEARAAWPDKLFWSNVNLGCYDLPADALKRAILERVEQAAPDGRRLAFEISEQLPARWRESIPVILAALKEARAVAV